MFPLKNKRSGRYKKDAVKDGICPHCGEVRSISGAYLAWVLWVLFLAPAIFGHFSTVGKNCGC